MSKVAVIVVHGGANQPRCESARAAADLLRLNSSGTWVDFVEDNLRIPVQAVPLRDSPDRAAELAEAFGRDLKAKSASGWQAPDRKSVV